MEKRPSSGTDLENCGALESEAASAAGVNLPLTQKPLA
jgi:hypothetical protein